MAILGSVGLWWAVLLAGAKESVGVFLSGLRTPWGPCLMREGKTPAVTAVKPFNRGF